MDTLAEIERIATVIRQYSIYLEADAVALEKCDPLSICTRGKRELAKDLAQGAALLDRMIKYGPNYLRLVK